MYGTILIIIIIQKRHEDGRMFTSGGDEMNQIKEDVLLVDQTLISTFQQTMQRVWIDNTLMIGLEEMRVILEQVIQSAEGSKEVLIQLSGVSGKREALYKEWDHKESVLQGFVETLTAVLQQYREERQHLER